MVRCGWSRGEALASIKIVIPDARSAIRNPGPPTRRLPWVPGPDAFGVDKGSAARRIRAPAASSDLVRRCRRLWLNGDAQINGNTTGITLGQLQQAQQKLGSPSVDRSDRRDGNELHALTRSTPNLTLRPCDFRCEFVWKSPKAQGGERRFSCGNVARSIVAIAFDSALAIACAISNTNNCACTSADQIGT